MEEIFNDCLIDLNEAGIVGKFRELSPELDKPFGLEQVSEQSLVKYIVATFDINSPFVSRYSDWGQRRMETGRYAEFPMVGQEFKEEAENIIFGQNDRVNHMIIWYLFIQNDIDFIQFQAYQSMFYKQIKASISADYDKPSDFDKLKNNIDVLTKEIKELQKVIFRGEESLGLRKKLYNFINEISVNFSPEDRAERLNNGEPVVDEEPYPGYMPDDLKFLDDE